MKLGREILAYDATKSIKNITRIIMWFTFAILLNKKKKIQ